MTTIEAQHVLLLHRPDVDESTDPQMAEALALARQDPELARWFEEHRAFQNAMREKFRQIEVPSHLKSAIVSRLEAERKIARPVIWWRQPAWLAAAAAAVALLGFGAWWLTPSPPDRFANYEARVVSSAIREYQMSIRTNNLDAVRRARR